MATRIIVGGSRYFSDEKYVGKTLDSILAKFKDEEIIILSGGCAGADFEGEFYAEKHELKMERYPAQWKKYGKKAGPLRNREMVDKADYAVVFSLGGKGTQSLISLAEKKGIPLEVFDVSDIKEDANTDFPSEYVERLIRAIYSAME